ncbi:LuxR C-terminal-related transcriptional regulator [Streptomyces sp. M19]
MLREVLTLMGEGYKDDAAARKLGLSVRTYRRYVADIMRDLGVDSRFQAGVRAVRSGLMEDME